MVNYCETKPPSCSDSCYCLKKRRAPRDSSAESNRKVRITEDVMAARLRNFHLTRPTNNGSSDWFFMKRPNESFEQLEERMSVSDDEEENKNNSTNNEKFELTPEVVAMIEKQRNAFSPWIRQPDNPLAVVLWKPKESFIDEILDKVLSDRIIDVTDLPFEAFIPVSETKPVISFPADEALCRRRKHKSDSDLPTSSGPIIQEISNDINVFDDENDEPMEM